MSAAFEWLCNMKSKLKQRQEELFHIWLYADKSRRRFYIFFSFAFCSDDGGRWGWKRKKVGAGIFGGAMKGVAIEGGRWYEPLSPPMQIASPFPSVLLSIFFPLLFLLSHFYSLFFFIPLFLIEWRLDWVLLCKPKGDLESQQFFFKQSPRLWGGCCLDPGELWAWGADIIQSVCYPFHRCLSLPFSVAFILLWRYSVVSQPFGLHLARYILYILTHVIYAVTSPLRASHGFFSASIDSHRPTRKMVPRSMKRSWLAQSPINCSSSTPFWNGAHVQNDVPGSRQHKSPDCSLSTSSVTNFFFIFNV